MGKPLGFSVKIRVLLFRKWHVGSNGPIHSKLQIQNGRRMKSDQKWRCSPPFWWHLCFTPNFSFAGCHWVVSFLCVHYGNAARRQSAPNYLPACADCHCHHWQFETGRGWFQLAWSVQFNGTRRGQPWNKDEQSEANIRRIRRRKRIKKKIKLNNKYILKREQRVEREERKWSEQMERSLSARQMDLSSVMEDVLRVFAQRL